uniref:Uncharacterized protein n=1 Tax=Rhizophora mucronata TaxID=61149 RepID=A0A2P2QIZ7_RHIMU
MYGLVTHIVIVLEVCCY